MIIYRKVIVSGGIFEVYSYGRPPNNNLKPSDGFEDRFQDIKDGLDDRLDRKDERRLQTVRDARNLTRRLALMNFNSKDKFITLTYAENMMDLEKADKDFESFVRNMKYRYELKGLKYLAVREKQKRGAIHFHLLCDWKHDFGSEEEIRHHERFIGEKVWKQGFVDIKQIDYVDNVGAYLIKYMTKNLSVELYKGKKIYLCSKGLERPVEYKGLEAEALIKFYELDHEKEVFTNSYESEYLGEITYKEYNLGRSPSMIIT